MKKIEAIIRTGQLDAVREALSDLGGFGLTVESARGFGRQQGQTELFRGSSYALNLVPKTKIWLVAPDDEAEAIIETIREAAWTGELGDGKIFVSEVLRAIRIRTRSEGDSALDPED
jgi:nitrogen regulatory protein P-II 1